ncbi:unnamed protein product, partial [Allacma fusca]
EYREAPQEAP